MTITPCERAILIGTLTAALVLTAVVASLPMTTLIGVVPDDAFYYMVVGRNIAATGVSTFDGENLASGYHPAWMMVVVVAAHWFPGNNELVRVVIAMSFLLHAATGWLLYLCLKRFMSGVAASLVAGFWMFGYLPLVTASYAMETSLYCAVFLLGFLVYLRRIEPYLGTVPIFVSAKMGLSSLTPPGDCPDFRVSENGTVPFGDAIPATNLLLFGAVMGLCLWARTEAIVLLACVVAWLGFAALRRQTFPRSLFEACRRGVLTGGTAMAAISPWLLYCLHTFGTTRQASGVMKMLWMQDEIAGLSLGERLWLYTEQLGQWLAYSLPWAWGSSFGVGMTMALGWLVLFAATWAYIMRSPVDVRRAVARVFPSVAYPLLHLFVAGVIYSSCFSDVQRWYLALPYLEGYLVLSILGGTIYRAVSADERTRHWPVKALAVAVVFTTVGLVRYVQTWQQGYWAWQRDVYASTERIDRLVPEHVRIGAFNAGIPGYFSRRRIINLDGLVNDAVVPYWQAKRFDQYLTDANIGVIYDEELSMARARQFSQGCPRLEAIARCPLTNYIVSTRFVWELKPSGDWHKGPAP